MPHSQITVYICQQGKGALAGWVGELVGESILVGSIAGQGVCRRQPTNVSQKSINVRLDEDLKKNKNI